MLSKIMLDLLYKYTSFKVDMAESYEEAQQYLKRYRYDFAVTDLHLPDANEGQIIPLVNRHNIAPIIFTGDIDEEFRETFESANIVDYVLKERYSNIIYVVEKLLQLEANRKKTILLVDDSLTFRYFLKNNLLLHQFNVLEANNGETALKTLELHPEIEMVITDFHMPVMDGLQLTREIRKKHSKRDLAVLVLTTESNSYTTSKFLKEGANDYITKPFSRDEFYARLYHNVDELQLFSAMEESFHDNIIELLCEVTEFKSAETGGHIKRISEYTYILAKASGMFEEEAQIMAKMATLHDIGKVGIPDIILCKPGRLTADEYEIMKRHTTIGKALLEDAFKNNPKAGQMAIDIALHHHERWDGKGYPKGLFGTETPLSARIVAIADTFDALANKRVYKEKWPMEDIIALFEAESGKTFDPKLVKLLMQHIDCFKQVLSTYSGDEIEFSACALVNKLSG